VLPLTIRPLLSERSVLSRADGSAKWAQDGSIVLAAVHGPHQAGQRKEDAEKAVVEVVFQPRAGLAGASQRAVAVEAALRHSRVLCVTMMGLSITSAVDSADGAFFCCVQCC
jgi:ribonuclease PH